MEADYLHRDFFSTTNDKNGMSFFFFFLCKKYPSQFCMQNDVHSFFGHHYHCAIGWSKANKKETLSVGSIHLSIPAVMSSLVACAALDALPSNSRRLHGPPWAAARV